MSLKTIAAELVKGGGLRYCEATMCRCGHPHGMELETTGKGSAAALDDSEQLIVRLIAAAAAEGVCLCVHMRLAGLAARRCNRPIGQA